MKIAFDYQIFGFQEYGGISRYICELSTILADNFGEDIAVIAPLYVNHYLKEALKSVKVFGMSVPRLPKTARIYRTVNSLLSRPALRYFRPDLVHETYYSPRRIAPAGAKVVLTVYDMIHERFADQFPSADPTSRYKALSVRRADHVICISEQTRRDVIELLEVEPSKTSVIHLGFKLTNQLLSMPDIDQPLRPFMLYVGRRDSYKNFERLAQVYAASPVLNKELDLVCFGGGDFTPDEKSNLRKLGVLRGFRHVSGGDAALAALYRSAKLFIYPSLYEGFGIPPLEAMSFDCPVVCSGVSSIPEVVGDAAEMFDPYDQNSMRAAIERVIIDETLRQTLIDSGRKRIEQFSWERCASQTLDVYSKVTS